jgi:2-polyprenyl-3-methyl-5-hydroxy-6-metoxy-1,4-benzoquinol methylase
MRITIKECLKLLPSSGSVLDIGCFNGYFLDILKEKGFETYGIDASTEAVKICNSKGHKTVELNLEEHIPFEENFFDAITGLEIIEHLADTDTLLKEIKRTLKPNGILIFSTPNFFSLSRRIMTLIGINPFFEASFSFPPKMAGHLRFFTPNLLNDFLKYHNFNVTHLGSDVVNFNLRGTLFSTKLAQLFPKIGRGIVISATNIK